MEPSERTLVVSRENPRGGAGVRAPVMPSAAGTKIGALVKQREEELLGEAAELSLEDVIRVYKALLAELTLNSKPIITDLTIITGEQREHGEGIVDAICAHIVESKGTSYTLIDVSSLVVANIDFHPNFCETAKKTKLREILEAVSHVKELKMGTWCIKALSTGEMQVKVLPAFSCKCLIVHLSQSNYYAYPGVKNLLQSSSMVEKLVLNFKEYGNGGYCLPKFVSQPHTAFDHSKRYLKIIHVHGLRGSHENLYILEFLLKHAIVLQKMVVHDIIFQNNLDRLLFAKKLLRLPKSSRAAVVRLPNDVDQKELVLL